jgi:PAS domain-containing protein
MILSFCIVYILYNMYYCRRPRMPCRISMDEDDSHDVFEETSKVYNTINFMNLWDNYDIYRKCNETQACVLSSINKNIVYVNKAWENLCGYTQHEIQGKGFETFQGKETNREKCKDFVNQIRKSGYAKMININYDRDRNPIRVLIEGYKIKFKENSNNYNEDMPHFWSTIMKI